MKHSLPTNFQSAGLREPGESADTTISPTSMKKLRIFKDHLNETPIVVVLVGSTTYAIDSLAVNQNKDFIDLVAALQTHDIVLTHINYEMLPQLETLTHIVGARIYVLDEVPDLDRTPSEMMAIGSYRHRIDLPDYMLLLNGKDDLIPPATEVDATEENNDDD